VAVDDGNCRGRLDSERRSLEHLGRGCYEKPAVGFQNTDVEHNGQDEQDAKDDPKPTQAHRRSAFIFTPVGKGAAFSGSEPAGEHQ
jgi:hypothetical protein